jgi:hypothetical protein
VTPPLAALASHVAGELLDARRNTSRNAAGTNAASSNQRRARASDKLKWSHVTLSGCASGFVEKQRHGLQLWH